MSKLSSGKWIVEDDASIKCLSDNKNIFEISIGEWIVHDSGLMQYKKGNKIIYEIEPEVLAHKERIYKLYLQPDLDYDAFIPGWLKACRNAKILEVTLKVT